MLDCLLERGYLRNSETRMLGMFRVTPSPAERPEDEAASVRSKRLRNRTVRSVPSTFTRFVMSGGHRAPVLGSEGNGSRSPRSRNACHDFAPWASGWRQAVRRSIRASPKGAPLWTASAARMPAA